MKEQPKFSNTEALVKLVLMAKKQIAEGQGMTPEDVLKQLRAARHQRQ